MPYYGQDPWGWGDLSSSITELLKTIQERRRKEEEAFLRSLQSSGNPQELLRSNPKLVERLGKAYPGMVAPVTSYQQTLVQGPQIPQGTLQDLFGTGRTETVPSRSKGLLNVRIPPRTPTKEEAEILKETLSAERESVKDVEALKRTIVQAIPEILAQSRQMYETDPQKQIDFVRSAIEQVLSGRAEPKTGILGVPREQQTLRGYPSAPEQAARRTREAEELKSSLGIEEARQKALRVPEDTRFTRESIEKVARLDREAQAKRQIMEDSIKREEIGSREYVARVNAASRGKTGAEIDSIIERDKMTRVARLTQILDRLRPSGDERAHYENEIRRLLGVVGGPDDLISPSGEAPSSSYELENFLRSFGLLRPSHVNNR